MPLSPSKRSCARWLLAAAFALSANSASAAGPSLDEPDDDDGPGKPITELIVTAKRLDAARANIEPSLGASTYTLTNEVLETRPGGETTRLNQVLLQTPGVAQDGGGQLHVRQSQG